MCYGRPKIHQTYRYGYIKDVILPRALDDATFATISSLMLFNNVEVCSPSQPTANVLLPCAASLMSTTLSWLALQRARLEACYP